MEEVGQRQISTGTNQLASLTSSDQRRVLRNEAIYQVKLLLPQVFSVGIFVIVIAWPTHVVYVLRKSGIRSICVHASVRILSIY